MLKIYCPPGFTAEKEWIFHFLLKQSLGLEYETIQEAGQSDYTIHMPSGKKVVIEDHFWKNAPSDWPKDTGEIPEEVLVAKNPFISDSNLIALYGGIDVKVLSDQIHIEADLIGSAFFMLSRWEEYNREVDGRFPAEESIAVKYGFIHRPVVDEYARFLSNCFQQLGMNIQYPLQSARLNLSCDVDHPLLWWNRSGRLRTLIGSFFKKNPIQRFLYWIDGPIILNKDPYDVFDEWIIYAHRYGHTWQFNFLGERPKSSDCYYSIYHPKVVGLIQKLMDAGQNIGFHPSQKAAADEAVFERELKSITKQHIKLEGGRQHYLHFRVPYTWRYWKNAGLKWESSMGFSEEPGFRCGTSHPFEVFDFLQQETIGLVEYPLIAMDVSLALYKKYKPAEGSSVLQNLKEQVELHGGVFTLLWHNSSWNTPEWIEWKPVLLDFISIWSQRPA